MQPAEFPYERNPLSTSCIPVGEGQLYYQGGLFGGRTPEFLEMKDTLIRNISEDLDKEYIAIHHDESHLNKYFLHRKPLCLSTKYGRPEEWESPSDPSIIFRKKEDVLGFFFIFRLKGKNLSYVVRHLRTKVKYLICSK
jgi:hypothetical protein